MIDLGTYFERYRRSWNDPDKLSAFFDEPFIAARGGETQLNRTREDTRRYFEGVLEQYRERGFHHAEMLEMFHEPLGRNSLFATIRWAYKDVRDVTRWEWSISYNLYRRGDNWKILLQTLHDE